MKNRKPDEELEREVAKLSAEVGALGLPEADLAPLYKLLEDFRKGTSYSGVLKLPQFNLAFVVKLSLQAHVHSGMRLTSLNPAPRGSAVTGAKTPKKPTKAAAAAASAAAAAAAAKSASAPPAGA